MKTIIFIGTQKSGSSRDAIKAADELGYYTVLFTNNVKQLFQRTEYNDVHLMKYCNLNKYDQLKDMIKELQSFGLKIKAIVSFVDSYCYIANKLAFDFGLNYFTNDALYTMENKILSRKALEGTIYCPKFIIIESNKTYLEKDIKSIIPGIIKSPKSAGSKDVYKIKNYQEFIDKLNILKNKYPNDNFLLEEFLDGQQLIAEVLVINDVIHIIGVIEQEISFINNHFIVTGYYLQQDKPDYYDNLIDSVENIIKLHGLKHGSCHLELKHINEIWKLIEINPRISGGGMNQLIKHGTGINLVEQTLNLTLGKDIDLEPKFKKHVYIQYKTSNENGVLECITGKNKTVKSNNILSVYLKPRKGNVISIPLSMGNRYAYVIATGDSKDEAEQNAKKGIEQIQFHITNE